LLNFLANVHYPLPSQNFNRLSGFLARLFLGSFVSGTNLDEYCRGVPFFGDVRDHDQLADPQGDLAYNRFALTLSDRDHFAF
jgi:hypothetical protein